MQKSNPAQRNTISSERAHKVEPLQEILENAQEENYTFSPSNHLQNRANNQTPSHRIISHPETSRGGSSRISQDKASSLIDMISAQSQSNQNTQALPLVTINETTGAFMVNESAVQILSRRTSNKIAIVSVFGPTGSGKSSFLNQLLKVQGAFLEHHSQL